MEHDNNHRPHRALSQASPLRSHPEPVIGPVQRSSSSRRQVRTQRSMIVFIFIRGRTEAGEDHRGSPRPCPGCSPATAAARRKYLSGEAVLKCYGLLTSSVRFASQGRRRESSPAKSTGNSAHPAHPARKTGAEENGIANIGGDAHRGGCDQCRTRRSNEHRKTAGGVPPGQRTYDHDDVRVDLPLWIHQSRGTGQQIWPVGHCDPVGTGCSAEEPQYSATHSHHLRARFGHVLRRAPSSTHTQCGLDRHIAVQRSR